MAIKSTEQSVIDRAWAVLNPATPGYADRAQWLSRASMAIIDLAFLVRIAQEQGRADLERMAIGGLVQLIERVAERTAGPLPPAAETAVT